MAERSQIMHQMRDAGRTYQQIGDRFGISRQRVHKLIGAHKKGLPTVFAWWPSPFMWWDGTR